MDFILLHPLDRKPAITQCLKYGILCMWAERWLQSQPLLPTVHKKKALFKRCHSHLILLGTLYIMQRSENMLWWFGEYFQKKKKDLMVAKQLFQQGCASRCARCWAGVSWWKIWVLTLERYRRHRAMVWVSTSAVFAVTGEGRQTRTIPKQPAAGETFGSSVCRRETNSPTALLTRCDTCAR